MIKKSVVLAATWVFLGLAFFLSAVRTEAQGRLNFTTSPNGVNAPATNAFTFPFSRYAVGVDFSAQLYIGPAGITDPTLLTTNGSGGGSRSFGPDIGAGYVPAGPRVMDGYAPGTTITVQLRAWWGRSDTTWESTPDHFRTGLSGLGAPNLIQVTLGGGTGLAPNLIGMQGFNIGFVPEPSTWALLALGGMLFGFRLRRHR